MRNVRLPARVKEEHSETAYMTDQAIRFIERQGEQPWFLHLSYVKPHWPYMAPAPYHALYGPQHCLAPNRAESELADQHPVLAAYRQHEEWSVSFQRPGAAATVRPAYMGLIKQIDDHLGRLFAVMQKAGRLDDTLIVFTADHGDFLGDHWLGEKEIFYEEVVRVPFIVVDPDAAADATRGSVDRRFVEAVDVVPTCLEALGLPSQRHLIEGRSLLALTRGLPLPDDRVSSKAQSRDDRTGWRDAVFSSSTIPSARRGASWAPCPRLPRIHGANRSLEIRVVARLSATALRSRERPAQLVDLGRDPGHVSVRDEMQGRLFDWMRARKSRVTVDDGFVEARTAAHKAHGIFFGVW